MSKSPVLSGRDENSQEDVDHSGSAGLPKPIKDIINKEKRTSADKEVLGKFPNMFGKPGKSGYVNITRLQADGSTIYQVANSTTLKSKVSGDLFEVQIDSAVFRDLKVEVNGKTLHISGSRKLFGNSVTVDENLDFDFPLERNVFPGSLVKEETMSGSFIVRGRYGEISKRLTSSCEKFPKE